MENYLVIIELILAVVLGAIGGKDILRAQYGLFGKGELMNEAERRNVLSRSLILILISMLIFSFLISSVR